MLYVVHEDYTMHSAEIKRKRLIVDWIIRYMV